MFGDPAYADTQILIVEDNDFARSLISKILHNGGARNITEATDGQDAQNKVATVKPDVVICDIEMKPMGGLEFLKSLRAGANAETPVIVLTSQANSDIVMQAKALGAESFLAKPVSTGILKDRPDRALAARKGRGKAK